MYVTDCTLPPSYGEGKSTGAGFEVKSETESLFCLFCTNYSSMQKEVFPRLKSYKGGSTPLLEKPQQRSVKPYGTMPSHRPGRSSTIYWYFVGTQQGWGWWAPARSHWDSSAFLPALLIPSDMAQLGLEEAMLPKAKDHKILNKP